MGEDDGTGRFLEVILRPEEAAERRARAEKRQEIGRNVCDFDLLGGAVAGERAIGDPDAGELIELRGAEAELEGARRKRKGARPGVAEAGPRDSEDGWLRDTGAMCRSMAFTKLKMAVFAPIPTASVRIMRSEKAGAFTIPRHA